MDRNCAYVSGVPADAIATVTRTHEGGSPERVEYFVDNDLVGIRFLSRDGDLEVEYSHRNGKRHGWHYRWDEPGKLRSTTCYVDDVEHGTAYQWADDGRLIGTYTMVHGTGTDLWWEEWDGTINLAEAYEERDGKRHGHEWWFHSGMPGHLSIEKQWHDGQQYGIEREWNPNGRLRRGYPRYWIHDQRVTRRKYLRAAAKDSTLPPFRPEDNAPARAFPLLVAENLRKSI